jgi:ketosteroid isomerase-like protein
VPSPLTPGDGQDVLARFKEALQDRDPDSLVELFADDAEYRLDPFEPPLRGALQLREHWNAYAAERGQVDFDAENVWVSGHTVLASWHAAYTRRADASRVRDRGFSTFELDDEGKVRRKRDWTVSREVGVDSRFKPEGVEAPREEHDG